MKIILTSVGTRGDMEPFLAAGELMKKKGHRVICAFPEQFGELAHHSGMEFASLGKKYVDLLESEDGKAAMGGATGFTKINQVNLEPLILDLWNSPDYEKKAIRLKAQMATEDFSEELYRSIISL